MMQEGFRPPASVHDIQALLDSLDHRLPEAYLTFLRRNDGYERARWEPVKFWASYEVKQKNENYHIQQYLPQCFAIGNSKGDFGFLLDRSISNDPNVWPVTVVDLGALNPTGFFKAVGTFAQWQQNNFRYEFLFDR